MLTIAPHPRNHPGEHIFQAEKDAFHIDLHQAIEQSRDIHAAARPRPRSRHCWRRCRSARAHPRPHRQDAAICSWTRDVGPNSARLAPAASTRLAVCVAACSSISTIATALLIRPNRSAMARPISPPPPVTRATGRSSSICRSRLEEIATALFERPPGLRRRNGLDQLVVIPGILRLVGLLHLEQIHVVQLAAVGANDPLPNRGSSVGSFFISCDHGLAVAGGPDSSTALR